MAASESAREAYWISVRLESPYFKCTGNFIEIIIVVTLLCTNTSGSGQEHSFYHTIIITVTTVRSTPK
jgi:hypothetical protein